MKVFDAISENFMALVLGIILIVICGSVAAAYAALASGVPAF